MKTRILPGDKQRRVVGGDVAPGAAGTPGIRVVRQDATEIFPVRKVIVPWAEGLDDEDDTALLGSEAAKPYTNDTGATLSRGDVVIIVGTTAVTTTTPQDTRPVGVVVIGADDGEEVVVQTVGKVDYVRVTASITEGNYAETSTTAAAATSNPTRRVGSFAVFLTSGTEPEALLFGIPDTSAGGTFLTRATGEEPAASTVSDAGATETIDLSVANWHDITLTENCTLTFVNPPAATGEWTLILRQGGTGSYTVTWPSEVEWQDTDGTTGGAAPTLYTAVGAVDEIIVTTLDGGTSFGGAQQRTGSSGSAVTSSPRILLADTRSTPFAFTDLLQMDDGSDFMWSDA